MKTTPRFTESEVSIPYHDKVSFDRFLKTVLEASKTNLHYLDFKAEFGDELKRMFRPVRLPKRFPVYSKTSCCGEAFPL